MKIKKFVLYILVLFLTFTSLFITKINVSAAEDSVYIINDNGVIITNSGYQKLLNVGYIEEELVTITIGEYQKIMDMNIVSIEKQDYYIKTITTQNEDGTVTSKDEVLTKTEAHKEINKTKKTNDATLFRIDPFPSFDNGGDIGGGPGNPSAYSSATTEYKYLTVNGTYYKYSGNLGTFFVKVNLTWLITPQKRLSDIISINFSDNVQIKSEYINGNQYPAFTSKFTYDERYEKTYFNPIDEPEYIDRTTSIQRSVNGSNTNSYAYIIDEGLGVQYDLPSNSYADLGSDLVVLTYKYTYSNFFLTLSADFIPKQTGINAATFAGTYQHQTGKGRFDWGNVSFSPAPPYFSYSTSFWINDPSYDGTLARQIFFEDLA